MTSQEAPIGRRGLLAGAAAVAAMAALPHRAGAVTNEHLGIDPTTWTPDYVRSIAGTQDVDTAAECAKVVPLNYSGRLTYWYVGPNQSSPRAEYDTEAEFWAAFAKIYPNIKVEKQNLDYNEMLNKVRTAALGNAAPMVAKFPIMWGVEFAAKGQLHPIGPEDIGYSRDQYWPGALKSVTWDGKTYGVPTNNETMALIWNAALFDAIGVNPDQPPATWDDLVQYSRLIKEKTGKNGYGMVARVNAGNTPFRYMPQCWAYGGAVLDETDASPHYKTINIDSTGSRASLQASYDMYVRDRSVPVSALTNTQNENEDPFIAGQLGMMIGHPSEFGVMTERAKKASGEDRKIADAVLKNIRYGLIPKGPARRAVVFGGSNIHMFDPDIVEGKTDVDAVRAFMAFHCGPEWSGRLLWASSNPSNLRGFRTTTMKQRFDQIPFLNVTTSMLPNGVPYPVIPESAEMMNIIVPGMLQNVLTKKMTPEQAVADAKQKIKSVLSST